MKQFPRGANGLNHPWQTPSLSADSDEVSLDLVVHDKKKKLVLDLKPTDLAVTDNGTSVTLSDLHLVNGESNTGHLITLVFDPMTGTVGTIAGYCEQDPEAGSEDGFDLAVLSVGSRLRLVQAFTGDSKAVEQAIEVATQEGPVQQGIAIAAAEKNLLPLAQTGVDASGKMASMKERSQVKP